MSGASRKRLLSTTIIYWMLLLYIVAALVWWFISLNVQNDRMKEFEVRRTNSVLSRLDSPDAYTKELARINHEYQVNKAKYLGEGSIFLLLILVGAVFIYRAIQYQFRMQQQQQDFMMAVTHELKTPISVARLNLETLQKYSLDPEKQKKLIRMTLEETSRLNFLTNNILFSSQLEARGFKSSKEDLDFSALLRDRVQGFRNRFPEMSIEENIEKEVDIKGDQLLLEMMINNLLENAIKYSPKDAKITALLKTSSSTIEMTIMDEGPGIPEEEKKKIFSKFYRIGDESTRKTQGTGLGLYLCQKIARDHNADILVTNNTPHGSKFVVIFHLKPYQKEA